MRIAPHSTAARTTARTKPLLLALAAVCALALAFGLAGCGQQKPAEQSEPQQLEANDTAAPEPEPEPQATPAQYLLVIGDDSWEDYTPGHADLMMLMRLDFEQHQIALVTVPRDTAYTQADGSVNKLNQVHTAGGPEAQTAAVAEVTGVPVTNYVVVGFDGLQQIVEHFGGLDVNLPYALDYSFYTKDYPNEAYAAGEQTLTPWRTMALSRTRTSYGDYGLEQDMMRQVVNRQLMVNLMKLAYADPAQTGALLQALQGSVTTNIPVDTQVAWANELAAGTDAITVRTTTGPFTGGIEETSQLWLVTPDPDSWTLLMQAIDAGKDPAPIAAAYSAGLESPIAPVSTTVEIPLS